MKKPDELTGIERTIDKVLSNTVLEGKLIIKYPSGASKTYGDKSKAVQVVVKRLPLSKLRNPTLFVGESYMSGNIKIDEDELDTLFGLMGRNPATPTSLKILEKFQKRQANIKRSQRKQISHHYDKGNDYYKLWLDKTMTYSCAYFHKQNDTLEKAQEQKVDYILRKLQINRGQKLLDIGCGWGQLAVKAAKDYGANVLGITLSEEQLIAGRELAKKSGVADNVRIELANYQDLPDDEKFERIVSVGMFEHVGRGNHEIYFKKMKQLLTDDGLSLLHTITQRTDKKASPWIDKYIFPGGYLPTVDTIEKLMSKFSFWSIDRENLWQHYARTLDIWRERHQAHKQEIVSMFDESFYRMQDFWLAGSAATFRYGDTGINQFIFTNQKPVYNSWPYTRNYLYN